MFTKVSAGISRRPLPRCATKFQKRDRYNKRRRLAAVLRGETARLRHPGTRLFAFYAGLNVNS